MKAKSKVPYFTAYVETEVEISPDDLHKKGWHHDSECGEDAPLAPMDPRPFAAAVASLHRQAHPRESRSVRLCHEEPCRSLTIEQLAQVIE